MTQKTNRDLPGTLGALTGLARTIALPHEYKPQRYPSFPALERTAVIGFSAPSTWNSTTTTGSNRFMLTRQAAWPMWGEFLPTTGNPQSYSVTFGWGGSAPGILSTAISNTTNQIVDWSVGNVTATSARSGISSTQSFAQGYPVVATDLGCGPQPFVYVPQNGIVTFILESAVQTSSATANMLLTVEIWTAPGECASTDLQVMNTGWSNPSWGYGYAYYTGNLLGGGNTWVRPRALSTSTTVYVDRVALHVAMTNSFGAVSWSASAQPSWTPGSVLTTNFLPVVLANEFKTTPLPWYAARTTAASVLMTNVTQVLNKAGTFLGGRVSPMVTDPFNVTLPYISTLHPAEKSQLSAENGFYTFCPPSTDLANFWDYTVSTVSGVQPCPMYRLDNDSLVNVFFHTDSIAASYSMTVDWHMEFRTSSALFEIAISPIPLEGLHQAQLALAQLGYFYNNFDHEKVRSMIKNIAKHLAESSPYGRMVLGAYQGFKSIALGNKPGPPTKPTQYVQLAGPRRQGRKYRPRKAARSRGLRPPPPPPPPQKKKGGLQMFLESRGKN